MSRILFDFLIDSPLLDEAEIASHYRGLSDQRLSQELQLYRAYVLAGAAELNRELTSPEGQLSVFLGTTSRRHDGVSLRIQDAALYFDTIVQNDPLFEETVAEPDHAREFAAYHRMTPSNYPARSDIAAAAAELRRLQPLVGAGVLKLAPLARYREPPREVPVYASTNLFAELIPTALHGWIQSRAAVYPLVDLGDGSWGHLQGDTLRPTRAIAVSYEDTNADMVYFLSQATFHPDGNVEGLFSLEQRMPDAPPDERTFRAWVEQSVNKTADKLLTAVAHDVMAAAKTGTMLATDSSLVAELLTRSLKLDRTVDVDIATLAMSLELPFLSGISLTDIARVRSSEGEAFAAYRRHLVSKLRGLRHEQDAGLVQRKLDDLAHEMQHNMIPELAAEMRMLKTRMLMGAVVGIASITALAPSGGVSLAPLLLGAADATKASLKYHQTLAGNPAYFLWQLKRTLDE